MSSTTDSGIDRDTRLLNRTLTGALLSRESVINRIKAIAELSSRLPSEPEIIPNFLISIEDLDRLWDVFLVKNQAVLDALLDLDKSADFDTNLETDIRALYTATMTVADRHRPTLSDAVGNLGNPEDRANSICSRASYVADNQARSRLPEIPLPIYNGDLIGWPVFRDRFTALVVNRGDLSNVERFYYLLGCLRGDALDTIRGITVSNDTYDLAWTTLSKRFNKPRQLAAVLVDRLIISPVQSLESLDGLKEFLSIFDDQVSILRTLSIPDLGDFLLFSMSSRCLALATRKGFEAVNTQEFPTMSDLTEYVKSRVSLLEAVGFSGGSRRTVVARDKDKYSLPRQTERKTRIALVASDSTSNLPISRPSCMFCPDCHLSSECPEFTKLSLDERYKTARDKKVCFRCLNSTHWSNRCKLAKSCTKCTGRHHTLLHKNAAPAKRSPNTEISLVNALSQPTVLLGTALVHIRDQSGSMQTARALIDSASQISVISSACVERLGLRRTKWTVPVSGLSSVPVPDVKGFVNCVVAPRYNTEHNIPVRAWILPKITSDMPSRPLPEGLEEKFAHLALADPTFFRPSPIDLLLGADVFAHILDGKRVTIGEGLPSAFSSLFGWIVVGPVNSMIANCVSSSVVSLTVSLEDMLLRFWQLEEPDSAPESFTEEGRCEAIYAAERVRNIEGRFLVPLPFQAPCDSSSFPGSRQVAIRRFQNLEQKLKTNDDLHKEYCKFMSDYESLGHMSVATTPGSYFIPHHPVFKDASTSKNLRVVFDASAVASSRKSLNQCLHTGPKLQQDIVDILLRFRIHRYAFTTDVCKMYRQILLVPKYCAFQHIFWRSSPLEELKEFELKTVTYGLNCAPYLALRVLQDIADQECAEFPDVRSALKLQTYVDDICVGADTNEDLLKLQHDLKLVLARAGFDLKKWYSNSLEVLSAIPVEDRASSAIVFDTSEGTLVKVLGMQWNATSDTFGYDVRISVAVITKRSILSTIARIFDPLGLLAPVIFLAKYMMQQAWKAEVSWDDPLPTSLSDSWSLFVNDLPSLADIQVPRFLFTHTSVRVHLCGFCDASERGYSAVVYLRVQLPDQSFAVSLLGCKSKTAPIKPSTIPRLELCAAVLLSRWMTRIKNALSTKIVIEEIHAWTDSQIVLSWLINPHTDFKVFVSNRVYQIQQLLPQCNWRYVRSNMNPADCASRGIMPSEFVRHRLYWNGPEFLLQEDHTWDITPPPIPSKQLPDAKVCIVAERINPDTEWLSRFSSYLNMLRVIAWMRRFIGRCRRQVYSTEFLCPSELEQALGIAVKVSQRTCLSDLYTVLLRGGNPSRTFAGLSPFIDDKGLIRIGGRLRHSNLPVNSQNPFLLSKLSHLSVLIARHWHLVTLHSGPRVITSLICRQFWIMSVRLVVRRVIGSCTVCVRTLGQPATPQMSDLPAFRVQPSPPFTQVGIDYAGPLIIRECRLRKPRQYKAYIAVFVCMVVKAVHLEPVLDLSTDAFLAAFDRFTSRRGLPSDIYSDCGTNFVGASKHLRILVNHPDNQERLASHRMCRWHFNPPSGPHFGGLWEAAVRSTKALLSRVMGPHNFSLEELSTMLCRIEAILNSRPLTPVSSSPLDLDYLTPGHFLIGRPLVAVPDLVVRDDKLSTQNRWKLVHQCMQVFWRRWSSEYLCSLQSKGKWTKRTPNLKPGDMVVVKDQKNSPITWRLGRIIEVMPGKDNVVRVVKVLTSTGEITRPAVKLVLLPTD